MLAIRTIFYLAVAMPILVGGLAVIAQELRDSHILGYIRLMRIRVKTMLRG